MGCYHREVLLTLVGHAKHVTCVAWNNKGDKLASGAKFDTVKIWEGSTSNLLMSWELEDIFGFLITHTDAMSINWNPTDDSIAIGCYNNTVQIWDTISSKLISILGEAGKLPLEAVKLVEWSPDGSKLAFTSSDHISIKIWNPLTKKILQKLEGHLKDILSLSWNPEGNKIVSCSSDKTLRIWDIPTGNQQLKKEINLPYKVSWSPSGRWIAMSFDTINILDAENKDVTISLKGHHERVTSFSWSPDGTKIISGSFDKTVKIWDVEENKEERQSKASFGRIITVAWNHDGSKIATVSKDKIAEIWDAFTGQVMKAVDRLIGEFYHIFWNRESSMITIQTDVLVYILNNSSALEVYRTHSSSKFLSWTSDDTGIVLYNKRDFFIEVIDAMTFKILWVYHGLTKEDIPVKWDDNHKTLITWSYRGFNNIKIWEILLRNGKGILSLTKYVEIKEYQYIRSLISNSNIFIAFMHHQDFSFSVFDVSLVKMVNKFEGHSKKVTTLSLTSDDRRIASGSEDNTIKIWEVSTGKLLFILKGHGSKVIEISWSSDNQRLVSLSDDGTCKIWEIQW